MDLSKAFSIGRWDVRPDLGTIQGEQGEFRLEPKQMQLLVYLAEHSGEVVSKEEVLENIWPDTHVSASGLTRNISQLRKVLGDSKAEPEYIRTIPKRGYQFLVKPRSRVISETQSEVETAIVSGAKSPSKVKVPILALSLLSVIALVVILWVRTPTSPQAQHLAPKVQNQTLAVLPLSNRGGEEEDTFFVDGLTEELIDILGRIEGLQVVARTSSFAIRGQNLDAVATGERLNVGKVLEGSVRRSGDRLRVSVHLVDTTTGFQVWSETYDRVLGDLFDVQMEIAEKVAGSLEIAMMPATSRELSVYKTSVTAYDNYLLGQYWCHKGNIRDFPTAIMYFEKAVDADGNYARAWSSLARSWILLGQAHQTRENWLERATDAAEKALALDPTQDEAHGVLGMAAMYGDLDWEGAEQHLRKAIAIYPRNPLNRIWYAQYLLGAGRLEEALSQTRLSLKLDPLNPYVQFQGAVTFCEAGDQDRALNLADDILEVVPDFLPAHFVSMRINEIRGNYEDALNTCLTLDPEETALRLWFARLRAQIGDEPETQKHLQVLLRDPLASPFEIARIYLALGDNDIAIQWLERAAEVKDPAFIQFAATLPELDPIRGTDAFLEIARKMNAAK